MLRLPDHPDHGHDPTASLMEPWTQVMGGPPTHIVWIKEYSSNSGETVFPYLAWTVAEPIYQPTKRLWHGTRPDAALAVLHSGCQLVPGPRRQTDGLLP